MKTIRLFILFATIPLLFGCPTRNLPEEDSGYSELSTVQPAEWEYRRNLPGQF